MAEQITPARHADYEKQDDAALQEEAKAYNAKSASAQLVAELLQKLRTGNFPWWTPEQTREIWNAQTRLTWFKERADLRQKITSGLTGLAPKAARNKTPDFQASLVDSVIEDGDVTVKQFDDAFAVTDLAAYGPIVEIWQKFRERLPWDQDTAPHQELFAWLIEALIATHSTLPALEGTTRKGILTTHVVRTTIPGKIWHTRIPLEVRVAIDDLRFQREKAKPGEPFHSLHDLSVATPTIIASNIPLRELARILDAAERSLGFPASPSVGRAPNTSTVPRDAARDSSVMKTTDAQPPPPPPLPSNAPNANTSSGWTNVPNPLGKGGTEPPPPVTNRPAGEEDFAFDDDDDTTGKAKKSASAAKR
ncbi:MAG: uncharacterized protein JWM74_4712 [Myxococcaceae bacterium]|nr:uncharacterized protein [Myxococcaceae bacterium]